MNEAALNRTLESGFVHYWSRSRQALWKKGETSGSVQRVEEILTDCDQDVLLVRASVSDRAGTCHTGRATCFYRSVPLGAGPVSRKFGRPVNP
jgi:phosphoribosyl-AMP cyclohydrolase